MTLISRDANIPAISESGHKPGRGTVLPGSDRAPRSVCRVPGYRLRQDSARGAVGASLEKSWSNFSQL